MLMQYVRDKRGSKIGIVVALDRGMVGWSLCNTKKDDFNKEFGLDVAMGRAMYGSKVRIPNKAFKTWKSMIVRSYVYFKV